LPVRAFWCSLAYGNGAFVAADYNSNNAAWSANGETWETVTLPSGMNRCSIAFGSGRFVVVDGDFSTPAAAWSVDGKAWTAALSLDGSERWASVAYGNGTFAALAETNGKVAVSSDGGDTWAVQTLLPDLSSGTSSYWQGIVFGE
jgi:hypothetical protein